MREKLDGSFIIDGVNNFFKIGSIELLSQSVLLNIPYFT